MDKSDVALWASVISAAFSAFSVVYARKMAKNDSERMKRKRLVFEVQINAAKNYAGWSQASVVARNLEPVAATINAVRSRKAKIKLLPSEAGKGGTVPWDYTTRESLPAEDAKQLIAVTRFVDPVDTLPSVIRNGPVCYFTFFILGNASPKDFEFIWEWADGEKS